jgi:DNA-binding transcriptional regulator YhcF (GntR family)
MATTTVSGRIADQIRADIRAGRLKIGDRLPTRAEIQEKHGIASMTAASVVRILRDEGLVESIAGRGVYVLAVPAENSPQPAGPQIDARRIGELEARLAALETWRDDVAPLLAALESQRPPESTDR